MIKNLGIRKLALIDALVEHYDENKHLFSMALNSLQGYVTLSQKIQPLIHTIKYRIKDSEHLKDKLIRKAIEAKNAGRDFDITKDNLFLKVNDLGGFRIIHLHTKQIEKIDSAIKEILLDQQWKIIEGPSAKTWDDESRDYFSSIGFQTSPNKNMYTSVHYVVQPNSKITCEIQVRTLMEEVWGEVDHSINYPHKTQSVPCREQIKALARATSSCSRLVDSIFSSHIDYHDNNGFSKRKLSDTKNSKALLNKKHKKK